MIGLILNLLVDASFRIPKGDHRMEKGSELILQTLVLDSPPNLRGLYWRSLGRSAGATSHTPSAGSGRVLIRSGATVSFDTYFNGFFEFHWRLYTHLETLRLKLELQGEARLRVWRRTPLGPPTVLQDQLVSGTVEILLPAEPLHFRQYGLVWFDLAAIRDPVTLIGAVWSTSDSQAVDVGLGIVICTFNRDPQLAGVLAGIGRHEGLDDRVTRVIVVNQGEPDLVLRPTIAREASRLGPRLRLVEQINLGGAGGFGRGLIEALDDPTISHVCFLDDDVRLEPDSLLRMSAFFALARDMVCLGGHMLDAARPTTLYEAGAVVLDTGGWQPLNGGLDLCAAATLNRLLDSPSMHYNGWWMFGFPKSVIAEAGMPLPCFIRGDDVEFGLRLHRKGIFTLALPGVGVWHEPFYLKTGGWQVYYDTRNALICSALHTDFRADRIAGAALKRLLNQLLTYRYSGAALMVRAIEDAMQGPAILEMDPRPLHASLLRLQSLHPQRWTRRETVLQAAPIRRTPRSLPGFAMVLLDAVARQWIRPTRPESPPFYIEESDYRWFSMFRIDALAVETFWDAARPIYRRNRETFRHLLVAGLRVIWRLYRTAPTLRRSYLDAAPRLTSTMFWRRYLNLNRSPSE